MAPDAPSDDMPALLVESQAAALRIVGQVTDADRITLADGLGMAAQPLGARIIAAVEGEEVFDVENLLLDTPPGAVARSADGTALDFGIDPGHDAHGLDALLLETVVEPARAAQKKQENEDAANNKPDFQTIPIHCTIVYALYLRCKCNSFLRCSFSSGRNFLPGRADGPSQYENDSLSSWPATSDPE